MSKTAVQTNSTEGNELIQLTETLSILLLDDDDLIIEIM